MPLPDNSRSFLARLPLPGYPAGRLEIFGKAFAAGAGPARSVRLRADLAAALTRRAAARAPSSYALGIALSPADRAGAGSKPVPGILARAGAVALRVLKLVLRVLVYAHIVFILSTSLCLAVFSRVDPGATVLMGYRKYVSHFPVKRPIPVKISQLSRRRRDILVRIEDWTFYKHRGFELAAIKNAALINKRIGRPMYGGSTLSMQTSRTIFLVPFKSYFRKYLEAIVTVELELILGKNRILELYYSYAEWGRGIFGIQAASIAYYGVPVSGISDEQYIRLVALLSSPLRYTPETLFKNNLLAWRYDFLMGKFDTATQDAKAEAAQATDLAAKAGAQAGASPSPSATENTAATESPSPATMPSPATFSPAPNG